MDKHKQHNSNNQNSNNNSRHIEIIPNEAASQKRSDRSNGAIQKNLKSKDNGNKKCSNPLKIEANKIW